MDDCVDDMAGQIGINAASARDALSGYVTEMEQGVTPEDGSFIAWARTLYR
jgi:hypothetical protein